MMMQSRSWHDLSPDLPMRSVTLHGAMAAQPPEKQQLFKQNTLLEDAKKLADLKVENDDILAVTFMQDGEA